MAARIRTRLTPLLMLLAGLNAGCDRSAHELQTEADLLTQDSNETQQAAYECRDGGNLTAQYEPQTGSVVIFMEQRAVRLQQAVSASGAKYEADGITFWSRGDEALLTRVGHEDTQCLRKADSID